MSAIERMSTAELERATLALIADDSGAVTEADIQQYTDELSARDTDAAHDALARIRAARVES